MHESRSVAILSQAGGTKLSHDNYSKRNNTTKNLNFKTSKPINADLNLLDGQNK